MSVVYKGYSSSKKKKIKEIYFYIYNIRCGHMLPISRVDIGYVNNSKNTFRNVGFYK
jgi:hypothetical protein